MDGRKLCLMSWVSICFLNISLLPPATAQSQRFAGPTSNSDLYNSMPAWQGSNWLGNPFTPAQDWKLGVQTDDLDTGVFVRRVAPGSAAARANLEVNDVIVAVGGQQVGIVDGSYIDISAEIVRRADANGNVTLLVQDGRTGRLAAVRVALDRSSTTIRGNLVRRDRALLPSDAVITVSLENERNKHFIVRNGQVSFTTSVQNNIPFEINYDPAYITRTEMYEVRAQVISGGRVIYRSIQAVRVLNGAPSDNIQLELVPVQAELAQGPFSPVITAGYGSTNSALLAQYIQTYRKYLGKDPSAMQQWAFTQSTNQAAELESLPLILLASQDYFDAVGNNEANWITAVFQQIIQRPITTQERDQWLNYLKQVRGSRIEVLRQLYKFKRQ